MMRTQTDRWVLVFLLWAWTAVATALAILCAYWLVAAQGGVFAFAAAVAATLLAIGPGIVAVLFMVAQLRAAHSVADAEAGRAEQEWAAAKKLWDIEEEEGVDYDGDGAVGEPRWDGPINREAQRKRLRGLVEAFITRAWRMTEKRRQNPCSNAIGLSRATWVGNEVPEPYRLSREQHDDMLRMLSWMKLIAGRMPGNEGYFTVSTIEEALTVVHNSWGYVKISPVWDEIEVGKPASQPARWIVET